MSSLPLENVQMADRYLGFMLIVLISLALARQFALSPIETTILGICSISLTAVDFNLTFTVLPSALILAMVLLATESAYLTRSPAVPAFLLGLMAGTLCSLKSIYLPHATLFCLTLYLLWGFSKGWRFAFMGWAFALIGALLILVPWMAAMRVTSGTYLYPLFGPGYDFSAYHEFQVPTKIDPIHVLSSGAFYFLPLAAIIFAQFFLLRRDKHWPVLLAITVAVTLGTLAVGFATGNDDTKRYNFPMVMPMLLLSAYLHTLERI